MDLGGWLRSLGLERYEAAFRQNEINEKVLPRLTAEDLKDLGVVIVGHRRTLLDAIAALRADANAKATPSNTLPLIGTPTKDSAERRQVTVMFSDLVGSTALSARMDPEDLREVIAAYHKCAAETVRRFGGFVSQYLGDGVLVYFGYPQAHEDDAERAVRAGLELMTAVTALKTRATLQTRVGIATGLVVVGDLMDAGHVQERGIIGETPNLAARLQGLAAPNSVVIAETTRRLLGNLFELEDLGPRELKGITGPVRAFVAVRPASTEGRFEAFHGSGLTELVGREEEVELLLRRWSKAKTGEGQVVLLSGEAGIGKSRLTAALLERLATEPHTRLRYFCSPQHTDSALYPIIGQMERAAGLAHDDTAQAKLDKLDALMVQSFTPRQDVALFSEMLSVPNDGRYPTLELTPQQRRQKTLEALTTQVEALSRSNPLLMIFEDVHWIDPTSLEALGRAVDRIRSLGVLLIVTYRPEFEAPWIGRPCVTPLTINRLGERDIAAMIDRVTGNNQLPASIRQDIIERTDGIPLFVEEMTKAVLEAEGEGEARRAAAAVPFPASAVPATLHASLMARLDRLGPAKEIAQIGSAIGREFSHALLAAAARKREAELDSALDRLILSGLLFRQGQPPDATYLFKHALVQEAAYGTLLREPRRALHARIAETLESQFPDIAETQPELLARHYTEAGQIEKAAYLWGKAGQRSLTRSAYVEASTQLSRALTQIASLPGTAGLRREQIKLQVALANALWQTKGYAALETIEAFDQARALFEGAEALGEPPEDPLLLFSILYGFWAVKAVSCDGDAMRHLARQILALAERQTATFPRMLGNSRMGMSLFVTGDIAAGRAYMDQAIALYDPAEHHLPATRFGLDVGVTTFPIRALALWALGYPDAALADAQHSLKSARELSQAATLMFALNYVGMMQVFRRNHMEATALAEELIALAEKKSAVYWVAFGKMIQGSGLVVICHASEAIDMLTAGLAAFRATGAKAFIGLNLLYLTRAYAQLNQFDDAWRCIGEAMTAVETTKESWYEAEVHRTAGEITLLSPKPDPAKAEAYFERALTVARQQQAKSWELRAAMSMARLWRDQGKRQQARELLAPVYGWFTEGFDTLDLKEAKALLDELAKLH